MKIRWAAIICCIMLAFLVFPAVALAYNFGGSEYNDNDYGKLKDFLNQRSDDGTTTNGLRLNPAYNELDPSTWGYLGTSVSWTSGSTDKRVTSMDWSSCHLAGSLDISGFNSLTNAVLRNNPLTSVKVSGDTSLGGIDVRATDITQFDAHGLTSLGTLYCSDTTWKSASLTSVNASGCTALTSIAASDSAISSIDVSGCTALNMLTVSNNNLGALDVSTCTSLLELYCSDNANLTSLKIKGASNLTMVSCTDCALTELDASGLTKLTSLTCNENDIETLDLAGDTALDELNCSINAIQSLDVSGLASLVSLVCDHNKLTSLTGSGNTDLGIILCSNNLLASLDFCDSTNLSILAEDNHLSSIKVVFEGIPVTVTAKGSGYLEIYKDMDYHDYYVTAMPRAGESFLGWTNAAGTDIAATAKYDLSEGTAYDITANFTALELSSSVADGKVYTGGRITLSPNREGGTWTFDSAYLSRDGNTFTALKAGKTTVTYTVSGASTSYEVTALPALALTSSSSGKVFTGGRITLTPNYVGGTWTFDGDYLSRDGGTFTALKAGTSTITYTAEGVSVSYNVTILAAELPETGQSFTWAWGLTGAAVLAVAAGLMRKKIRN